MLARKLPLPRGAQGPIDLESEKLHQMLVDRLLAAADLLLGDPALEGHVDRQRFG